MPTASAVVADLIEVATGRAALSFNRLDLWRDKPVFRLQPPEDVKRRYYMRFNVQDRPHVLADIADILGRNEISIASVIQHEAPETDPDAEPTAATVPLVVMTHCTTEGQLRAADTELDQLTAIDLRRIRMPVAD